MSTHSQTAFIETLVRSIESRNGEYCTGFKEKELVTTTPSAFEELGAPLVTRTSYREKGAKGDTQKKNGLSKKKRETLISTETALCTFSL